MATTQEPVTYARETILTTEQVAEAMQISVRQVSRLNIPTIWCGPKCRRYRWGAVLDFLDARAL